MESEIANRPRLGPVDGDDCRGLARATLDATGRPGAGLTVAFVRDRRIRDLNRDFRGKDVATDVLSFQSGDEEPDAAAAGDVDIYLGDVVISTDAALRQATDAGHSFEREVSELIIHGALHLCGYDHETDDGQMNRLELKLRRRLLDPGRRARAAKR